jgi:hypothetical protein
MDPDGAIYPVVAATAAGSIVAWTSGRGNGSVIRVSGIRN